jgi:hypothetical protein
MQLGGGQLGASVLPLLQILYCNIIEKNLVRFKYRFYCVEPAKPFLFRCPQFLSIGCDKMASK